MTAPKDAHDSENPKISRDLISQILKNQKVEMELAKRVEEISIGLEHIPTLPHHTELGTGFHVMGMIFAILGFFRALNAFLSGERLSPAAAAQLAYAMALLVLVVIGILLPAIALVIGVVAASISFAMSAFRLIQYGLKRWTIYAEQRALKRELVGMQQAWREDNEALLKITQEEDMMNLSKRVKERTEAIAKWNVKYDRSEFAREVLLQTHVALRAFSIFSASLGLTGAIFLMVPALALTGGVLLIVVASLVGIVSLGAGVRYIKRRWFSTAEPESSEKNVTLASPEVSDAAMVEKSPRKKAPAPPSIKSSPLRHKEDDEDEGESDSDRPHH